MRRSTWKKKNTASRSKHLGHISGVSPPPPLPLLVKITNFCLLITQAIRHDGSFSQERGVKSSFRRIRGRTHIPPSLHPSMPSTSPSVVAVAAAAAPLTELQSKASNLEVNSRGVARETGAWIISRAEPMFSWRCRVVGSILRTAGVKGGGACSCGAAGVAQKTR